MEGLAATDLAGSKTGLIAQVKVKAKASEVAITRDAGDVGAGMSWEAQWGGLPGGVFAGGLFFLWPRVGGAT